MVHGPWDGGDQIQIMQGPPHGSQYRMQLALAAAASSETKTMKRKLGSCIAVHAVCSAVASQLVAASALALSLFFIRDRNTPPQGPGHNNLRGGPPRITRNVGRGALMSACTPYLT
jgi:hypothetical protein